MFKDHSRALEASSSHFSAITKLPHVFKDNKPDLNFLMETLKQDSKAMDIFRDEMAKVDILANRRERFLNFGQPFSEPKQKELKVLQTSPSEAQMS